MQLVLCNKNSHILHYSDNPTPLHSVQFIFINLVILQAFTQNIISVATAISRYTQQLLHNFLHLYNFEYTPSPKKGTVLRRRLRWAAWRYSTGKEASLALPLLLIAQHLYIRGISAAY